MEELKNHFGNDCQVIRGKEVWKLMQKWRENYANVLKERTGKWKVGDIDWHVFSYNYHPYVLGDEAQVLFEAAATNGFYAYSSSSDYATLALKLEPSTDRTLATIEDFLSNHTNYFDLYLIALDMSWTMVCTHEPSFATIYAEAAM